jgi:hypothetical protein
MEAKAMSRPISAAAAMLAVALLAGCAGGFARLGDDGFRPRYADYAGETVERFTTFRLDGWSPVSRNSVIVWNGPNEAYLLKVWDTCRDLQDAERIGVTETARSVSKFERLRVGRDTCPIQEIRRIDVQHYKADLEAARAAQRVSAPEGAADQRPQRP